MILKRLVIYLILTCMMVSGAVAGSLANPEGKPILVISGAIENKNNGDTAEFDRDMLVAMGMQVTETANRGITAGPVLKVCLSTS